jgi:5'-3' exonuclease
MGIPSYFRRILQAYPGCLAKQAPVKATVLAFDFNCLIYRCMRAPGIAPYPGDNDLDASEAWETSLLKEVRKAVKEIWTEAGRPGRVFLAIDGVVPMAKIRQQRVRRFKSAWIRRNYGGQGSAWDSNAITPGTEFMERLAKELKGLVTEQGKGWVLSDASEPGEGEHKIMHWLRGNANKLPAGDVIVYGLDADLILLCMLVSSQTGRSLWLMREKQEFGTSKKVMTDNGAFEYQYLCLEEFVKRIGLCDLEEIINYIGIMSFMGNDFLPHSLTHKLNDDGHECVMRVFQGCKKTKRWLIQEGLVQLPVLLDIVKGWGLEEEDRMLHMIQEKQKVASRGVGRGMEAYEALPHEWAVERELMAGKGLRADWRAQYWSFVHPCVGEDEKRIYCEEYIRGFQWILDYYLGFRQDVSLTWMFGAWLPPLWSDFACLQGGQGLDMKIVSEMRKAIEPQEQLAMVLPLESWGLVRDSQLRTLPLLAPQMWPAKFSFLSLGRRYFWECEARIPVLTAARIRNILADQE